MKPYVICHMNTSIDGRTWVSRWRPAENRMAGLFERIHEQLGNGSWLIGRVTGSEYAKADAYPVIGVASIRFLRLSRRRPSAQHVRTSATLRRLGCWRLYAGHHRPPREAGLAAPLALSNTVPS